jgi:nitrogen fixation NifU-like protein
MNALSDLYQEVILDHSRHPRNFGHAEDANREAKGYNPLCGDRIAIYLRVEDGLIADVTFEAKGCAISLASASMMTELVKGKTENEAEALFGQFHTMVTGRDEGGAGEGNAVAEGNLEDLEALSGVREFPSRIKCATLAWHAMKSALLGSTAAVKTE